MFPASEPLLDCGLRYKTPPPPPPAAAYPGFSSDVTSSNTG